MNFETDIKPAINRLVETFTAALPGLLRRALDCILPALPRSDGQMRYWLSTTYVERDGMVELLSVGIVSADRRSLYAQRWSAGVFNEADDNRIADTIVDFCGYEAPYEPDVKLPQPEIWSNDTKGWLAFMAVFQDRLPAGWWPDRFRDIRQLDPTVADPSLAPKHALRAAEWSRQTWEMLTGRDSTVQSSH